MLMFLRPRSASGPFISQLRRLSTIPIETCPCSYLPTFWKWYWKENGNVWRTFGKDRWGRNLENMIEQAYLDKLEQGKPREKFKFITPQHEYKLFFYSTGMYQENLKTGTRRPVRRRPGKFVCSEDVEDLKWKFGNSTDKEQVSKVSVESKYTPTHWSPMPPYAPYLRAGLTQSSNEFKVVEHLFRRTMNDYVNIMQIDRIQNPFMMEKYYRKKENMALAAKRTQNTVDERQLFHGTSPDAVEAICKQNFDWRLHGKNATVYGQGSYFAKKASYSHAYAKRDPCGFQYIFLAKVLVGAYTTGHSSYRRPPPKRPSDPASDLYDSCVDKQSNPTVFVVFDTDQFYPEYLIKYTTATQTTSSTGHHALPQPATAVPARTKTKTSSQPASGKQRQLASSTYPVGKSSYPDESDAFSGLTGFSPPVYRRPKAQALNTNTPVVSATYLSGAVLRNANSSTLSANQPRRPLGTTRNLPGSATGSVSSSIAASWSHPLKSSNHPASTTSSSGSVSQSRHTPMVTSTIASRKSTPSVIASSQSAAAVESDFDCVNGFDSSYVVLPSTSQTAVQNTSQPSSLNPPYASSMGSTRTADTSIVSSTSSRGSFTDTNENTFPQKKKKEKFLKCPIS